MTQSSLTEGQFAMTSELRPSRSPSRHAVPRPPAVANRIRRRRPLATRVTPLVAALLLFFPGVAFAHLGLRSSTPRNGASLTAVPREIRLSFSQAVDRAVAQVRLLGANGVVIPLSDLRNHPDSGDVLLADVGQALSAGAYRIEWQVIGKDGHPVRGTIPFVIAVGAAGVRESAVTDSPAAVPDAPATGPDAPPTAAAHHPASMGGAEGFGASSAGYVVVRALQFSALLLTLGAVAFAFVVLGILRRTDEDPATIGAMRDRAARIGFWASATLLATVLLRLYAQSVAVQAPGSGFDAGFLGTMLTSTIWGWGWILQAVAAVGAIMAFHLARRGRDAGWTLAAIAALALAVTPALSGHAASTPRLAGVAIVADTLHVIGASGWLGSLVFLLAAGIPVALRLDETKRGQAVARVVNAFSPTALGFAGLAALTGLFSGWLHIGFSSALWESTYGRTLLIKLAILSVVIGTGAYNWLKVRPALGDDVGTRRIRRSATVEVAVGVLVVIVTAILVATPPPMEMGATAGADEAPSEILASPERPR